MENGLLLVSFEYIKFELLYDLGWSEETEQFLDVFIVFGMWK